MNRLAARSTVVVTALALWSATAAGQTVYRCGPAGNQYSQQPCPEGKAIDVSDSRSPAQTAEARAAVRDQHRLAADMARERKAEAAAHKPAMAGGISLSAPADDAKKPSNKRNKSQNSRSKGAVRRAVVDDSHEFVAIAPGSGKKTKKAQD